MIYFEINFNNDVTYINYFPFDKANLDRSTEDLLTTGYLVESIPEQTVMEGKIANLKYDNVNNKLLYEYEDIPVPEATEIEKLKANQILMQKALDDLLMGGM